MTGGFLRWWIGELLGLLPRRALRWLGAGRDRLVVVAGAEQASFALETASGRRELGTGSLGRGGADLATRAIDDIVADIEIQRCDVLVLLAPDHALRRGVSLPPSPGIPIRAALEREIERYTPFRAEQVYFLYAIDSERSDDRSTSVELAVAPRRFLDPMVDRLVSLGADRRAVRVGIVGIQAVLPAGSGEDVEAAPVEPMAVPGGLAAALIAVAVLTLTALAAPTLRLYFVRYDVASRAQAAQADAEQLRRMLGEVERQSAGLEHVVSAKTEAPSVVRVLDRLSALLPDDTYLNQFNVVGREIEIEGTTRASAALVRVLESSPLFEKVSYVAPVTRDPVSGAERFHFSIQYAGRKDAPAPKAAPKAPAKATQ